VSYAHVCVGYAHYVQVCVGYAYVAYMRTCHIRTRNMRRSHVVCVYEQTYHAYATHGVRTCVGSQCCEHCGPCACRQGKNMVRVVGMSPWSARLTCEEESRFRFGVAGARAGDGTNPATRRGMGAPCTARATCAAQCLFYLSVLCELP
jgi:hypothetical protein